MKPDGGSAFPRDYQPARVETWSGAQGGGGTSYGEVPGSLGMSLRDYFAAQALIAIGPSAANLGPPLTSDAYVVVRCYMLADAMLAERAK